MVLLLGTLIGQNLLGIDGIINLLEVFKFSPELISCINDHILESQFYLGIVSLGLEE